MVDDEHSGVIASPPDPASSDSSAAGAINPSALTVEQAARVLTAVGGRWTTVETIRSHIQRGAPTAVDGRINLMHYMAWLTQELADAEN